MSENEKLDGQEWRITMKLYESGVYLIDGNEIVEDGAEALSAIKAKSGLSFTKEEAAQETIAYGILKEHNSSGTDRKSTRLNSSHIH